MEAAFVGASDGDLVFVSLTQTTWEIVYTGALTAANGDQMFVPVSLGG